MPELDLRTLFSSGNRNAGTAQAEETRIKQRPPRQKTIIILPLVVQNVKISSTLAYWGYRRRE